MTTARQRLALALLIAVLAALLALSRLQGDVTLAKAGIVVGLAIASWAFGLFGEPLTTLIFFLLVVLFHVAKPEIVFSGFASTAWWLVFGGSITAIAVESTGLGRRLADLLLARVSGAYWHAVTAVAVATVALAFLMPSTNGRVLLLIPIVLAFAERLGLAPGRPGHTRLVLTAAAGSYMPPTTILPANVPNSILLGAADSLYDVKLTYGPYLLLHFPILGALKTVLLVWLVCRLCPEPEPLRATREQAERPMGRAERRLLLLLALSLLLFATDSIHGVSPAWVALGTGLLCLLPGIGVLAVQRFAQRANLALLLYIAGILGLGAVVADSGLATRASHWLLHLAPLAPGRTPGDVAILTAIGIGLSFLTTVTGVPAVLTPLAQEFATASGLPLLSILMLEVVVFATVLLPYQSPPMMVALQLGGVRLHAATRLCLALAALTIFLLWPLDYLWWRFLGYLP